MSGESAFRMPAEWEPHEATWIAWPHNESDWPGKLAVIDWVYAEIVRHITPGEMVRILVNDPICESHAKNILTKAKVDLNAVQFFQMKTNRSWTRDFGPMFALNDGQKTIVDFQFNGWAKYEDWGLDNQIAEQVADHFNHPIVQPQLNERHVVLEGGAIDVNGRGTLITTEECLLDPEVQVRNPDLSSGQIESTLKQYLGASNVLWLGRGIVGDDTHGHVDDLCRFVNEQTVVLAQEAHPNDANHRALAENRDRLEGFKLEDGRSLEIVELPMPGPVIFDGERLPASYANFYIANQSVLVPTFNDPNDRIALGILSELFPTRSVTGIHAVDLVWGLGTLHCLTQQEPA